MTQGHDDLYQWTIEDWVALMSRVDKLEKLVTQLLVHQHQYRAPGATYGMVETTRPIGLGSASV